MSKKQKSQIPLIPHFIDKWRAHRGLTQDEVAAAMQEVFGEGSWTRPNLSKVERGTTQYDQAYLTAFATVYRCEPWQLLAFDPADADKAVIARALNSDAGARSRIAHFIREELALDQE